MAVTWKKLAYEEDVVLKSLFGAQSVLAATTDDTPAAVTVAEQTIVGRKTGGNVAALTATEVRAILNVEDGADVTDADNVASAGAIMESDIVAKGDLIVGSAAGTPAILTKGTDGQVLKALASEATGLVWGDAGAPAAHAASHKNGGTDELLLSDFGEPTAAVKFDGQQATNLVTHNVADATARVALTPVIGKIVFQVDELAFYGCTVAV
jgi:hypothetical protein